MLVIGTGSLKLEVIHVLPVFVSVQELITQHSHSDRASDRICLT